VKKSTKQTKFVTVLGRNLKPGGGDFPPLKALKKKKMGVSRKFECVTKCSHQGSRTERQFYSPSKED